MAERFHLYAGHIHGPMTGTKMWGFLAVTLVFVSGEATAGVVSHALALLAEAGHNLSDALVLGLAAYALLRTQEAQGAQPFTASC